MLLTTSRSSTPSSSLYPNHLQCFLNYYFALLLRFQVHNIKSLPKRDKRKCSHAPFPYGYFGNALHFSHLRMNSNMTASDIGQVIELMHQHVVARKEDEFWSGVEWSNSRKDDQGKVLPPINMYGPQLTCVDMESMTAPIRTYVNVARPLMYGMEFLKDQESTSVLSCGECGS